MGELVAIIARTLVDYPEEVTVSETIGNEVTVIELKVAEADMGKVIGKQGKIAKAIRSVVKAAASKENCKYIVEAANGPTTTEADEILLKRGITVVPDIFANSGGVIVSYFEWVQNIQELTWERDQVNDMLENLMSKSFREIIDSAKTFQCTLRMAAYIVALKKLIVAEELKGIFP